MVCFTILVAIGERGVHECEARRERFQLRGELDLREAGVQRNSHCAQAPFQTPLTLPLPRLESFPPTVDPETPRALGLSALARAGR